VRICCFNDDVHVVIIIILTMVMVRIEYIIVKSGVKCLIFLLGGASMH
jgi:hypothetical protein